MANKIKKPLIEAILKGLRPELMPVETFPYFFGNKGEAIIKYPILKAPVEAIYNNQANKPYEDSIRKSYALFLKAVVNKNLNIINLLTEFNLSYRIYKSFKELEENEISLKLANPEAPIDVRLLMGKCIRGGYINRRTERKAELTISKDNASESSEPYKIIEYNVERKKKYGRNISLILNCTAEISSKRKLVPVPNVSSSSKSGLLVKEEDTELHYVTVEKVLFDSKMIRKKAFVDINKIATIGHFTIVDIDFFLRGNPHSTATEIPKKKAKKKKY